MIEFRVVFFGHSEPQKPFSGQFTVTGRRREYKVSSNYTTQTEGGLPVDSALQSCRGTNTINEINRENRLSI